MLNLYPVRNKTKQNKTRWFISWQLILIVSLGKKNTKPNQTTGKTKVKGPTSSFSSCPASIYVCIYMLIHMLCTVFLTEDESGETGTLFLSATCYFPLHNLPERLSFFANKLNRVPIIQSCSVKAFDSFYFNWHRGSFKVIGFNEQSS